MNYFKNLHPIVSFIYFAFIISFSCFFMHPVCLFSSLFCAVFSLALLKGRASLSTGFLYILPMMLLMALINPLFNHAGITVLGYLPSGNPLTLEAIIYGLASAGMISSVICWFSVLNEVITSDKLIYLFGKAFPSLSLLLSMTLRFIPRLFSQIKNVSAIQKVAGSTQRKGIISRIRRSISVLSSTIGRAFENAIDTSDSMKARGYGLPGRTSFSIFKFERKDKFALLYVLILSIYTLVGFFCGKISFDYFPKILSGPFSFGNCTFFFAYLALCLYPIICSLLEVKRWKSSK